MSLLHDNSQIKRSTGNIIPYFCSSRINKFTWIWKFNYLFLWIYYLNFNKPKIQFIYNYLSMNIYFWKYKYVIDSKFKILNKQRIWIIDNWFKWMILMYKYNLSDYSIYNKYIIWLTLLERMFNICCFIIPNNDSIGNYLNIFKLFQFKYN